MCQIAYAAVSVAHFRSRDHDCDFVYLSLSRLHSESESKQHFQFDKLLWDPRVDVQPFQPAQNAQVPPPQCVHAAENP